MSAPISPDEAAAATVIPDVVFDVVNGLLAKRGNRKMIEITLAEVTEGCARRLGNDFKRQEMFDQHWLDFEDAYRAKGWTVFFDKPAFNENYPARWKFSR